MKEKFDIVLDIGGTKVLGAVFNAKKEIVYLLKKMTKSCGDDANNVEKVIINCVEEMLENAKIKKSQIHAISAGAPGVIDQKSGIVLFSPNLPWRDYDIRTPLEKKFGAPFFIGNDVNVGVLGEYKYGAGVGYQNIAGFFIGTGMGGGLILNGQLFTGNQFKAAEYGHMILDPEGPLCGCGQRGCLEAFASKKGMTKYMVEQIGRGRESYMADKFANGVFRSKYLKKAYKEKDILAREAIDRACHYLAIASGNMINTISPDLIVYGGGVMEAMGDVFMKGIIREVDKYCLPSIRKTVDLKKAALGDYSILYGALAIIDEELGSLTAE